MEAYGAHARNRATLARLRTSQGRETWRATPHPARPSVTLGVVWTRQFPEMAGDHSSISPGGERRLRKHDARRIRRRRGRVPAAGIGRVLSFFMLDKLNSVEVNYEELMARLASPSVQSDSNEYPKHAKVLAEFNRSWSDSARTRRCSARSSRRRASPGRRFGHARARRRSSTRSKNAATALMADIKILLIPKDPNDLKNVGADPRGHRRGEVAPSHTSCSG